MLLAVRTVTFSVEAFRVSGISLVTKPKWLCQIILTFWKSCKEGNNYTSRKTNRTSSVKLVFLFLGFLDKNISVYDSESSYYRCRRRWHLRFLSHTVIITSVIDVPTPSLYSSQMNCYLYYYRTYYSVDISIILYQLR